MLLVRDATSDDLAAIDALRAAAFVQLRHVYRPAAEAPVPLTPSSQLVATRGGSVVGAVCLRPVDDRLHLIALAVVPQHQRRGVARAIVEHAAARAAERGCRGLSLYTIIETDNVGIFERLGFRVSHAAPAQGLRSVTGEPLTEAFMERSIRGDSHSQASE